MILLGHQTTRRREDVLESIKEQLSEFCRFKLLFNMRCHNFCDDIKEHREPSANKDPSERFQIISFRELNEVPAVGLTPASVQAEAASSTRRPRMDFIALLKKNTERCSSTEARLAPSPRDCDALKALLWSFIAESAETHLLAEHQGISSLILQQTVMFTSLSFHRCRPPKL